MISLVRLHLQLDYVYADNVILYREIHGKEDVTLQKDLDIIVQWAQMWLRKLNLVKCEHLNITNQKNPRIQCIISKVITSPKLNLPNICMGVIITHDLSWHNRIVSICNKANLTRAFLQRNLKQYSPLSNLVLTLLMSDPFWNMLQLYGRCILKLILQGSMQSCSLCF